MTLSLKVVSWGMLITSQNAREMAARGALARRQKKEAEALRLKALEQAVQFGQQSAVPTFAAADHKEEIKRLRRHIEKTDRMLDDCADAAEFVKLTQARSSLHEMWCHLAGIPKPGSRRPGKVKESTGGTAPVAPIEE